MADFARVLAALDHVNGWESLRAYKEATDSAQEIVVESSTFSSLVRDFAFQLAAGSEWKGTATQLLELLTPRDAAGKPRPPDKWPKNARAASSRLKRDLPALAAVGVNVAFVKDGERYVVISADPERSKDKTQETASVASVASGTTPELQERPDANPGDGPPFASGVQDQDANGSAATSFASSPETGPDLWERSCEDAKDARDGSSQPLSADPVACTVCGNPLDQALIDAGFTDHGETAAERAR